MNSLNGFVIVDKPAGITSHDVVGKLRRTLGTKRVGHAGTLDPMATGVLVLGINTATKFLQYITEGKKSYLATIRLGQSTSTDDKEGELLDSHDISHVTDRSIQDALGKQVGTIMQVPSKVSAIKIGGKRAYDLVREGKEVEIPARQVEISKISILEIRHNNDTIDIDVEVDCSAGTYIRSIARDLGELLGVGGHLIALRRTLVAPFDLSAATPLENPVVLPLAQALKGLMPARILKFEELAELKYGRALVKSDFDGVGVGISPDGEVAAIIENRDYGAQPIAVFVS